MSDFLLDFQLVDTAVENSTCIIMSNGGNNQRRSYHLKVTDDGLNGFEVSNGSFDLPIYLYWRDAEHPTPLLLTDGVQVGTAFLGNTGNQCNSSPMLSYLEVEFLLNDYLLTYAPSGVYSANLELFYERDQGNGDYTDNINIQVDIAEIVSLSGLQDISLDYSGWTDGSIIENVQSFCVCTNDSAGEVNLTPSSTTLHNGNSSFFGLQGPTETRRYNVRLREAGGNWNTFGNIDNGTTVGTFNTAGRNVNCSNGGENIEVRIRIAAGQLSNGKEGSYSGVLALTVTVP